ncbi:MAG: hypothetical protein AAFO69_12510 [Bacteroidota bacterium]
MKKQKDIRKNKELYKMPENYFDEFQARMSELATDDEKVFVPVTGRSTSFSRLAYVIPVAIVLLVAGYLILTPTAQSEDLFAEISTSDLIEFLEQEGISEDELISLADISAEDLEAELQQYTSSDLLEDLNDAEVEELSEEIDLYEEYL